MLDQRPDSPSPTPINSGPQEKALEIGLTEDLSIVQRPPGTGRTPVSGLLFQTFSTVLRELSIGTAWLARPAHYSDKATRPYARGKLNIQHSLCERGKRARETRNSRVVRVLSLSSPTCIRRPSQNHGMVRTPTFDVRYH